MEWPNSPVNDPWRKAILAERKRDVHPELIHAVTLLQGLRENALILGDASLIQSRYLLDQAGFAKVVDVDSSPSLLDDDILKKDDERIERVLSTFETYNFPKATFDLVYGKSIAFNPKETTQTLLSRIYESLKDDGVFSAQWAGDEDSFRNVFYTEEELRQLYEGSGLQVMELNNPGPKTHTGLIRPGTVHNITIVSKKRF